MGRLERHAKHYFDKGHSMHEVRNELRKKGHSQKHIDEHMETMLYPQQDGNWTKILLIGMILLYGLTVPAMLGGNITGYIVKEDTACKAPMIPTGTGCCYDTNGDGLCDNAEADYMPEETEPVEQPEVVLAEEKEEEIIFKPETIIASRNGFSIGVDAYAIETYEDWGKLTNVNFTLANEGDRMVKPIVTVNIYDEGNNGVYRPPEIRFEDISLDTGEYVFRNAYIDVSFTNPEKPKILELVFKDAYTFPRTPLVTLQHKFSLE